MGRSADSLVLFFRQDLTSRICFWSRLTSSKDSLLSRLNTRMKTSPAIKKKDTVKACCSQPVSEELILKKQFFYFHLLPIFFVWFFGTYSLSCTLVLLTQLTTSFCTAMERTFGYDVTPVISSCIPSLHWASKLLPVFSSFVNVFLSQLCCIALLFTSFHLYLCKPHPVLIPERVETW